jgi:hypothetical protein
MMHCSAPTGPAKAATIAIIAVLGARTLAPKSRVAKRIFFKLTSRRESIVQTELVTCGNQSYKRESDKIMVADLPTLRKSECIQAGI